MNGRDDRGVDETAVGERQEVEAVVDQIELCGALEDTGDVERSPRLGVDGGILGVAGRRHANQPGRRD